MSNKTELSGRVQRMTSPQAGRSSQAVLVVPVGSTEQHGSHLPLSTDTEIAVALAARLATIAQGVVVAPPLSYGSSGEHAGFPGTLSIGNTATELVIVELVRSASETWKRVLLISTHGGNSDAIRAAVNRLRHEGRNVTAWFPTWCGDAHAGHTETSIMLRIAPELVNGAAAEAGAIDPVKDLIDAMRAGGVACVSPNGVLGDPTRAEPQHGEQLLAEATADLVRLVTDWVGG